MRRLLLALLLLVPAPALRAQPEPRLSHQGPALAHVRIDDEQDLALLQRFDMAEARHGDEVDVVLWPGDLQRLRAAGFEVEVVVPDLVAATREALRPAPRAASHNGRTSYRALADYGSELRGLASRFPDRVRLVEGAEPSLEGRTVLGVEIGAQVARPDGRPWFFMMGLHHAREWPSAEVVMDFATDLAEAYGTDPRITSLLERVKVLAVPVVNPDGFVWSRDVRLPVDDPWVNYGTEYWRKNRRAFVGDGSYAAAVHGVDPNRNYGYQWGDGISGASYIPYHETYQGLGPFSEPETRNVRSWVLSRHVTTLLTNHTYSNLILWPWGHTFAPAPDAALFEDLGLHLAQANSYQPQQSIELYPTTGTTEDWSYATTGGLGFTFELGCCEFHPPYEVTAAIYERNHEAFLRLAEAAAEPAYHAVVRGRVIGMDGRPVAATLRLEKTVHTPTHLRGSALSSGGSDTIATAMSTGEDGTFVWHVNPSTRPVAGAPEAYALTVDAPGHGRYTGSVMVRRGGAADLGDIILPAA